MADLVLDKVSKIYRPRRKPAVLAVNAVDLEVKDGEIVALLGSSGCGKTSTLRMIAGFEEVSQGAIRIGGRTIHQLPPAKRDVAMAFEGYSLYPPLRVQDNIGFALLREKRSAGEIAKRVRALAEMLEIADILGRYPATISAGQQQRTSLARALIRRAPVSLFDEPMSQLEPQLRAILRARLKDYLIEHRMTTVFVTHDQTEAIALADCIAVMEQGDLQQYGTPVEIKERPSNLFVASFIGEPPMNVFAAAVRHLPNGLSLEALNSAGETAFRIHLSPEGAATLRERVVGDRPCRIGIRPHRLVIPGFSPGTGAGAQDAAGRITSNHWLGDQTHVGLDIGGCTVIGVADRPIEARLGDTLPVRFPEEALHLFDPETGRALAHGLTAQREAAA
jgi:multiple sugar transport system ATP-binding protein